MVYNIYFDLAALILNLTLISIVCLRKSYPSRKRLVYRIMLFDHLFAIIFDIISAYSISFLDKYPLAFNYGAGIGYYFFSHSQRRHLCHVRSGVRKIEVQREMAPAAVGLYRRV